MADQTSSSIVIDATPEAVMAVIADFERYPEWAQGVHVAEIRAHHPDGQVKDVYFEIAEGPIKDNYTLRYDWSSSPQALHWTLAEGKMLKALDGTYLLTANGASTEVTYRLAVELGIPMIGMLKRKAEKVIIDIALKGLKKRVESPA